MKEIKEYVKEKKEELRQKFNLFRESTGINPTLIIIQVGNNDASNTYIKGKMKDSAELGVNAIHEKYDTISEKELLDRIEEINNDSNVHGLLVQLPLPKDISEEKVKRAISPIKDVDGFNEYSTVTPCTPGGIINYLNDENVDIRGKNALVVGRSNIVGLPMAKCLLDNNASVTVVHSKTPLEELKKYVANADIIVCAVGRLRLLDHTFEYKDSAILIDVGINRDEEGKLYGDIERGLPVAFQSPVPGGVGLLTRITIFTNLLKLMSI